MSSYEHRLIRKQINLKLYCMSNKEAQEKDFLNSSQMITERQQMYMIIKKHFREKDNRRTSKKQLPFKIESTSLPHVNIASINRLFQITNKITENSKEMDKVIKVHSYRTATPYYTNPELTLERGNFMNYSQHVGTLLHTPRYIKFLGNLKKTGLSNDHQPSEKNSHLSSNSNSSRFSTENESSNLEYKSNSSSHSFKSSTLSLKVSESLSLSSSKSSLIKSSTSPTYTDKQRNLNEYKNESFQKKYDHKFENRNSSEATLCEDSNNENEETNSFYSIHEKDHSRKNSKISVDSSKFERNIDIDKKLSSQKSSDEDIVNFHINPNEDQNFSNKLLENNSNNNDEDSLDNINYKSKEEINRSISSQSNKNETNINMNENQEKQINETSDFPDIGKKENSIIIDNENKLFSNSNFLKEIEEYFNNNEIQQDEIQPMRTYFETAVHFWNTKPDYVSDFSKFLAKRNQINFINFSTICNKYALGNFTNEEVNKVKSLFNKFSEKSKFGKDNINETKYESENEFVPNEGNKENLTNEFYVNETKSTGTKSPEIEKTLNDNLEIDDKNNLNDEHFDENEDFSESFNRMFRESIPEISKNDLIALKQLVDDYKNNIRPNTNTNLRKNSYKTEENNDSDFSESFHILFRNSIGDITNRDINFFPNVVRNTEETELEINSREKIDNSKNNFRSSIGEISQSDLDNIPNSPVNHQNSFNENENGKNESSLHEDDFNNQDDLYLDNKILMSFRSLFRNSIDYINENDFEKIDALIKNHEKEFIGN